MRATSKRSPASGCGRSSGCSPITHALRVRSSCWTPGGVLRSTHRGWRLALESRAALGRLRRAPGVEVLSALLLAPLHGRRAILDRLRAPATARAAVEGSRRLLRARDTSVEDAGGTRKAPPARRARQRCGSAVRSNGPCSGTCAAGSGRRPHLDATTLMRLGVTEGPVVGAWLRRLRRARYDGTLEDAAAARRLVRRQLEERS